MDTDKVQVKPSVELVQLMIPIFTGSVTKLTWQDWKEQFEEVVNSFLQDLDPKVIFQLAKVRLHTDLRAELDGTRVRTWSQLDAYMTKRFPLQEWTRHYVRGVQSGTLFVGQPLGRLEALAQEALERIGKTDFWAATILDALVKACEPDLTTAPDEIWNLEQATVDEFDAKLEMVLKHVEAGRVRILKQGAVLPRVPAVNPIVNTARNVQAAPLIAGQETKLPVVKGEPKAQPTMKPKGNQRSLANQVKDLQAKVEILEQGNE
ncbi:hypothetical protein IWQ62_006854 [Dispira parvispora]|uniref:Retrotransposon gag domain-containing protein n=1 Tax=Dispira parvispora TaxID=1520584 RepID=A0A9W8AHL6_9FUNG|nr:hypothetical protein IWQ62_006854 [Dispira parvispora]